MAFFSFLSYPYDLMNLSSLAAKQKRIRDWQDFARRGAIPEALRAVTLADLKSLQEVLAECWASGAISAEQERRIADLERRLEQQNEEARLAACSHSVITKRETAGNGERDRH